MCVGGNNKKGYDQHLKLIVLNLYNAWCIHPELYVGYSRDISKYCPGTRLSKLHLSFKLMTQSIDALMQAGYIKNILGFHDRVTGYGRNSKMIASDKLINSLLFFKFESSMVMRICEDPIILRDKNKDQVECSLNSTMQRKRAVVNKLNKESGPKGAGFGSP